MSIFKCKMCGGDLNAAEGTNIVECEYCGTKQTIPTADNEKKINLFNRANRLRIGGEFDKAATIYENIIAEFPEEAEAYWGICLCNYGIEYVDDPATAKKIPTCHRASFESLQKDENYNLALEYADVVAQKVYRDEAREIDRIMSEILAVSKSEKPYDVFICYKETDEKGERTIDSVLSQNIYDALTDKGMKVFFARISLEDKLGQQYEPYIIAALNSAKVMLAVGTKYEYYHAVWVKNEWSRFLKLMAKDKTKVLIPCYKDLDAYDMPDEFKMFQAQDMGKIGAVQDIVRGIEKILSGQQEQKKSIQQTQPINAPVSGGPNATALLKRGQMAIEDGEFEKAKNFFDEVLNMDAECAEAYLGLALAETKMIKMDLKKGTLIIHTKNFQRAKQFAEPGLYSRLSKIERDFKEYENQKAQRFNEAVERVKKFQGMLAATTYNIFGLKSDGTVLMTKNYDSPVSKVSEWTDIVYITVDSDYALGLKNDGTVVYVSKFEFLRSNVTNWRNIVAISEGYNYTIGLKGDGTVVADGTNTSRQCNVSEWTDIVSVSTGNSHTVGLKRDGTVVAVGNNKNRQCAVSSWNNIIAVSAGAYHTVGLKGDGTVVATGRNDSGECDVSDWTDIIAVAAGFHHTVGLKQNGTVVATSYRGDRKTYFGQCNVAGWTNIVAIATGFSITVGLKSDGTVIVAGKSQYCQSNDVNNWKLFDNADNIENERIQKIAEAKKKREARIASCRAQGRCQYCGGTFKGLFTKKCSKCGREKDY